MNSDLKETILIHNLEELKDKLPYLVNKRIYIRFSISDIPEKMLFKLKVQFNTIEEDF